MTAVGKLAVPSFRGNSYMLLPSNRIPVKGKRRGPSMYLRSRENLHISLNFSTIEVNGLLFWSEHDGNRFLGLGLENNQLKLASNLLESFNNTALAPVNGILSDGSWHNVQINCDHQHLQLQLDGTIIFSEKLAFHTQFNVKARTSITNHSEVSRENLLTPASITYEDSFYLGKFIIY